VLHKRSEAGKIMTHWAPVENCAGKSYFLMRI